VPALEKALDIIEHLSEQAVPMTQAQLARALGRQPGELFRMLAYLEQRGYLRRDQTSGGYSLTLKLFELSRTHSAYDELLLTATPLMNSLTDELREPCHLSVLHRDRLLVLSQSESPKPFRLSVEVGSLHSPVATVSGRLLLAAMKPDALSAFLEMQPDYLTMSSAQRRDFHERLALIRDRGFDHSDGEKFIGWLDLGVLIGSERSRTRATLTLAALKQPAMPDLLWALPRLKQCATDIARQAGLAID
jgi:DNA-binding IclR family transcriptional regulator